MKSKVGFSFLILIPLACFIVWKIQNPKTSKRAVKTEIERSNRIDHTTRLSERLDSLKVQTELVNRLLDTDFSKYGNQTVDLVLTDLEWSYVSFFYSDEPPCFLSACYFKLENGLVLSVRPKIPYKFLERESENRSWDLDLFMKEEVGSIQILYLDDVLLYEGD